METELQGMYRTMESKPAPSRLVMVVDALQEGEELAPAGKRAGRKLTSSAGS
jgi:hypothetical protein